MINAQSCYTPSTSPCPPKTQTPKAKTMHYLGLSPASHRNMSFPSSDRIFS